MDPSSSNSSNQTPSPHAKILEDKKPQIPRLKRRNGLLRTEILARSQFMQIAKRNAQVSPLLRLPAEIRNKIWRLTVGQSCIGINYMRAGEPRPGRLTYYTIPTGPEGTFNSYTYMKPTFAVLRVCRQIYVEASAMVYTCNLFGFYDKASLDSFIRRLAPGQRRLVTSIIVPPKYFHFYVVGDRKRFSVTFPNIKRVVLPLQVAHHIHQPGSSVYVFGWQNYLEFEVRKSKLERLLLDKEAGRADIKIDWY